MVRKININSINIAPQFSQEQSLLHSMFGGGDKVLFNNHESRSLPEVSGALMPHSFGDELETDTAEIGGFFKTGNTGRFFGI